MAEMSRYCRAYPAEQLRRFPEWSEHASPLVVPSSGDGAGDVDAMEYFFLHDNYVVTAAVHRDEQVAFDRVTEDWKSFCRDVLAFDVPDEPATSSR